jgi:hypothetical protein
VHDKGETFKEVKIANQSFLINTKELETGNLCEILNKKMQQKQLDQKEQINGAKAFTFSDMSDYTDDSSVIVSESSDISPLLNIGFRGFVELEISFADISEQSETSDHGLELRL